MIVWNWTKWFLLFLTVGILAAQHGSKPRLPATPGQSITCDKNGQNCTWKSANPPAPDTEERYACQLSQGFHKCSCPAMVAEVQEPLYATCARFVGKAYQECIAKIPKRCDIIQKADTSHTDAATNAAHTCQRSCTHARCRCDEGVACYGPSLTEPQYSGEGDGGDQ